MLVRLVMIQAAEPLRTVVDGGQHIGASGKLHGSAIDAGLRVDAERQVERGSGSAEIAQCSKIERQLRIRGEELLQSRNGGGGGDLQGEVGCGMLRGFLPGSE